MQSTVFPQTSKPMADLRFFSRQELGFSFSGLKFILKSKIYRDGLVAFDASTMMILELGVSFWTAL